MEKRKTLGCIPDNAILVTADVVELYPSIPHQSGLIALKEALGKSLSKKIPTDDLIRMAEFVLSNSDAFQKISGKTIGTKFAPPYACIYMDQVEQKFLAMQINQPLIWLRYIFYMDSLGKRTRKICQVLIVSLPILSSPMNLVKKIYHSSISKFH